MNLKPCSVIICHYSLVDDYGGERAKMEKKSRSEMLRETISSLATNTDYPAEIIVIDNGGDPDDSDFLVEMTRRGIINTYVRNKNNMYFGWAWNQGAKLATSEYLCFTCNDIYFYENWLQTTMWPLVEYPDRKYIATPIITPDKNNIKYARGFLDGYRLNTLAGSNCMIMHRDVYKKIGEFTTHSAAGTLWHRRMASMGYIVVATPQDMVTHLASKGGVDYEKPIQVKETLLNGEIIDFTT